MENTITGVVSGFVYEKKEREAHPKNTRGHCGWRKGHRRVQVFLIIEESESGRELEVDMYNYVRLRCLNTAINAKVVKETLTPLIGLTAKVEVEYDGRLGGVTLIRPRPA